MRLEVAESRLDAMGDHICRTRQRGGWIPCIVHIAAEIEEPGTQTEQLNAVALTKLDYCLDRSLLADSKR